MHLFTDLAVQVLSFSLIVNRFKILYNPMPYFPSITISTATLFILSKLMVFALVEM